jgi:hypothetical protein
VENVIYVLQEHNCFVYLSFIIIVEGVEAKKQQTCLQLEMGLLSKKEMMYMFHIIKWTSVLVTMVI